MKRKDLKKYSNWYNGKQRLFIGRFHSFIFLRGGLGYNFWKKWSKLIIPCSLFDFRVMWNEDINTGFHLPQSKDNNSYGRRLYQRHVSTYYVERDFDRFGLNPQGNILTYDSWSLNEHKEHCLGIKRMRKYQPLPKDSVLLPVFCDDIPFDYGSSCLL